MGEIRLVLLVVILLGLNVMTSIRHSNYYKKTVNQIIQNNSEGYFGIGMTQSIFKKRNIVLMVTSLDGVIKECQVMSGLTIFAKFKPFEEVNGQAITDIPEHLLNGKYGEALTQAIEFIESERK
ncbi:transcriptional regulator GutM [Candidatus Enterococcus mangumiae]|uniref:Transcriptional regulator n=1 Tax=Candidatus Enterococcus mangumiae TaxID=2230878 RepID=A0ABZ2SSJ3_9ENTE|nr:transcriptional regulator GutM [Enterococcus sp. DIV1094]MBO0490955.1 hypothetical protein [Enterococcus sp. DIV1094]